MEIGHSFELPKGSLGGKWTFPSRSLGTRIKRRSPYGSFLTLTPPSGFVDAFRAWANTRFAPPEKKGGRKD
jgi:hypothetical protein